jgi:hypothetical protein
MFHAANIDISLRSANAEWSILDFRFWIGMPVCLSRLVAKNFVELSGKNDGEQIAR